MKTAFVFTLVAATALLAGCSKNPNSSSNSNPSAAPPPPMVRVQTLQGQTFEPTQQLPGRVVPVRVAEVRPQVAGLITAQSFREGSFVKAGALLYRIEAAPYQAQVQSAQAELQKAKANVASAKLKLLRLDTLLKDQAVSQQERDDAFAALQQFQADVALAKARLRSAQINLNNTRITAPIAGRIGRSAFNQGALVQAGQPQPLATIAQLHPVYVDLNLPAGGLNSGGLSSGRVNSGGAKNTGLGKTATLLLTNAEGKAQPYPHPGQVLFAETQVDPNTGSQTLRAQFPNPEGKLLAGMYVQAELRLPALPQAILVPQNTVLRDTTGQATVWVVSPQAGSLGQGQANPRPIRLGAMVGTQWHVESGLQAGEQLVVEGATKLKPGQTVKIKNSAPSADTNTTPSTTPSSVPSTAPSTATSGTKG